MSLHNNNLHQPSSWRKLLFGSPEALHSSGGGIYSEHMFRYIYGYLLSCITFLLLSLSIVANWYEGNTKIILFLSICDIAPILAIVILRYKRRYVTSVLFFLNCLLIFIGVYLLLIHTSPDYSFLLWFVLFPTMAVFSMGLHYGSLLFFMFYTSLVLILIAPFDVYLPFNLSNAYRIRLLLCTFGAFCFAWCAEYIRHSTYQALKITAQRLEQSSFTDALTGLGNRRDFDHFLPWAVARTRTNDQPFSLALIDIDHFKKINDTYGHDVGDLVLKHLAEHLGRNVRNAERLFRWGGEEFVLIMPDTSHAKAMAGAERLRTLIEDTPFMYKEKPLKITISIGVHSTLTADTSDSFNEADKCLYEAKSTGRNKVVGMTS